MAVVASWASGALPDVSGGLSSASTDTPAPDGESLAVNNQSGPCYFYFEFAAGSTFGCRSYIRMPAVWPSSSQSLMALRGTGYNTRFGISGTGNPGRARLIKAGGGQDAQSPSGSLLNGQFYRCEMLTDHTAGTCRVGFFPLGSDTPIWDSGVVSTEVGTSSDRLEFGAISSADMGSIALDDITVTDDATTWVGRASWDAVPTATVAATVWDGAQEAASVVSFWDGQQEVATTLEVYG